MLKKLPNFTSLIIFLSILLFNAINLNAQCDNNQRRDAYKQLAGATYLRDFKISLPEKSGRKIPVEELSMIMNKGSRYRFVAQGDPTRPGNPVVIIYDNFQEYVNAENGTQTVIFEFECTKTQVYNIQVSFQNGKDGCCILMLGLSSPK
ncbi:MAG TPA: hypothetical protein PK990_07385 [Salinivirgaceae bacterium]|nr:hypothetical protein [Salinivirgaceae bacterium]